MKKKTISVIFISLVITIIWSLNSCKKETISEGTDKELFDLAKSTTDFKWFKNSDVLLEKSTGTGHSQPYLRTRYNAKAQLSLNAQGKIITGSTFAEGSLIVKELYADKTTLNRYAILYKNSKSINADAKGWVWGYINVDNSVALEASKKGTSCINCHSQSGNIDYMLMNKFFP